MFLSWTVLATKASTVHKEDKEELSRKYLCGHTKWLWSAMQGFIHDLSQLFRMLTETHKPV